MHPSSPLVSVVVPAYNCESSIKKCVLGLLHQTYENIEIILVDDGSTDNTAALVDELAGSDNRIIVVHQPNGGPNVARGCGIANAHGTWLTFVDSDDTLVEDAIERFVQASSDDYDIVVGFAFDNCEPLHTMTIEEWRSALIKSDVILCTPWGKLFRCSILTPEVCIVNRAKCAGNDMPMNIKISFNTEKDVLVLSGKFYNYTIFSESISHSAKWTIDKVANLYNEVVSAIPPDQYETYLDSLIENRLRSLLKIISNDKIVKKQFIGRSEFFNKLRDDINRKGYKHSTESRLVITSPDSYITALFVKFNRKMIIAKQFIRRKWYRQ